LTLALLIRRAGAGAALGFAVGLSYYLPSLPVILDMNASPADSARSMIGNQTLSVMVLAVLVTIALNAARNAAARAAAVVLAIAATIVIARLFVSPLTSVGVFETSAGGNGAWVFTTWHTIAVGVVIAVYYAQVERARVLAGKLHAAQLQRQHVERGMLEGRLNVIRARVDPAFLFESLSEVRRAYERDRNEAERLLKDLIAFLRASLPKTRERASTLGDEIHLAATYLSVVSALRGRPFRLHAELPEALARAFFPPAVLLPLVDAAFRRTRTDSLREASILLRGTLDRGHARMVLEDAGDASAAGGPNVEALRATLCAFLGEARAAVRADSAGCSVALEFPVHTEIQTRREVA